MTEAQHGSSDKQGSHDGIEAQEFAGAYLLEQRRSHEASDHSATPVILEQVGGILKAQTANIGTVEVIREEAANRYLRTNINKNSDCSQNKMTMPPDGIVNFAMRLRRLNSWQFEKCDDDRK